MYDYAVTVQVNICAFVVCVSKLYKKNEKNFLILLMEWTRRWVVIRNNASDSMRWEWMGPCGGSRVERKS